MRELLLLEQVEIMNLISYIQTYGGSMSKKKRKQLRRQISRKLVKIQPRILEAKVLSLSANNKIFKYRDKLLDAQRRIS